MSVPTPSPAALINAKLTRSLAGYRFTLEVTKAADPPRDPEGLNPQRWAHHVLVRVELSPTVWLRSSLLVESQWIGYPEPALFLVQWSHFLEALPPGGAIETTKFLMISKAIHRAINQF